jgi:predicted secreted protein
MLLLSSTCALADDSIESRPLHFVKGSTSATIQETIKGDKTIDYTVSASAGQTMTVTLKTSNASNYFNVLPPGSTGDAIFVGSSGGSRWQGVLAADGEYKIRVYLMRNAARRNETAKFSLTVGVTGHAGSAMGPAPAHDAKVAGTPYHASGKVPCSMGDAPRGSAQCDFGVIRGRPGNAEVHLTPPGGLKRVLYFAGDKVTADAGAKVKAGKKGDLWSVEVNDYEHYQIPEAVILGG